MSTRNYVGARYVPKFADPVEWQANTSYEAMVIVTYNNSSYTSKIPVPPTVGNPAENSKYWALTGNYNAQVEEYRKAASDAQEHARDGICANDEGNHINASKNYDTGDYLWWHGMLYRAIRPITRGEVLYTYNVAKTDIADGINMNSSNIKRIDNDVFNSINNLTTKLNGKIKYKVYTLGRVADKSDDLLSIGIWIYPSNLESVPTGATLIPIHAQYHYFKTSDELNDSNNPGYKLKNPTITIGPRETDDNREAYHVYVREPDKWSQAGYYLTIGVLEIM